MKWIALIGAVGVSAGTLAGTAVWGYSRWLDSEAPPPAVKKPATDSPFWEADPLPPRYWLQDYETLHEGMTHPEISQIVGDPGNEVSRSNAQVVYAWVNLDGTGMNATFIDDKLSAKSQLGLKKKLDRPAGAR